MIMALIQKLKHFIGGRIIKTALSVFLTALICNWLHIPAIFAIITAIVTIEPTASDSIQKGIIRFFASAIGAGYAILFLTWFGHTPFTYAFVTAATIMTCHKLRLEAGMLVATLTAVAMASLMEQLTITSFFIRLSTTTIGIVISTIVNLLILPPKYSTFITNNIHQLYKRTANVLEQRLLEIVHQRPQQKDTKLKYQLIIRQIEKTEQLCHYQKQEWKFHRYSKQVMRKYHYEHKKLAVLQQMLYHLANLVYLPFSKIFWDEKEKKHLLNIVEALVDGLNNCSYSFGERQKQLARELFDDFKDDLYNLKTHSPDTYEHIFSPKSIVIYEILSIYDLVEELHHIHLQEEKHQNLVVYQ
jgi:uncharacterized membrane protein YgaE (UPF0421/DUF939 family)